MGVALNIERSISGQPWRWRRPPEPSLGMDALVDELLLARGVEREDLARHREPRLRDFLPDPSCFQDMDKGAKRLADAVQAGETIGIDQRVGDREEARALVMVDDDDVETGRLRLLKRVESLSAAIDADGEMRPSRLQFDERRA